MSAMTVNVTYHHEDSSWWAESEDVEGFSAAGATLEEVRQLAREGVSFALGTQELELRESDGRGHPVVVLTRVERLGLDGVFPEPVGRHLEASEPLGTAVSGPGGLSHGDINDSKFLLRGLTSV